MHLCGKLFDLRLNLQAWASSLASESIWVGTCLRATGEKKNERNRQNISCTNYKRTHIFDPVVCLDAMTTTVIPASRKIINQKINNPYTLMRVFPLPCEYGKSCSFDFWRLLALVYVFRIFTYFCLTSLHFEISLQSRHVMQNSASTYIKMGTLCLYDFIDHSSWSLWNLMSGGRWQSVNYDRI